MSNESEHAVFASLAMTRVRNSELDAHLSDDSQLRILFLWGIDCPNCEIAKAQLLSAVERFRWPDVTWLHDNVYEDPTMGTRFGLHGIPAFIVFRGARKLGRISQWPGTAAFLAAIEKIRAEPVSEG